MRLVPLGCLAGLVLAHCGSTEDRTGSGGACSAGCADSGTGGSAGLGGDSGDAQDSPATGGVGGGEGCVDIVVSPQALPNPSEWASSGVTALPGGMWRDASGVHVVWHALKWLPNPNQPPQWDAGRAWLAISTFDPNSGLSLGQTVFDPYPAQITNKLSGLYSVGARPDGTFVVGYDWFENGERPQRAMLFHVGEDKPFANVALPVAGDPLQIGTQLAAAWDGEAFALHAYGAPPQFTLHVARIDDKGAVVLPLTEYGSIPTVSASELGSKTSTSAESGRTYVFSADSENYLAGHDRTGAPLPGTAAGPKVVDAIGFPTTSTVLPVVSADAEGAWLAWMQSNTKPTKKDLVVQRLNMAGDPVGAATKGSVYPLNDPGGLMSWTGRSLGSQQAVLFAASDTKLYSMGMKSGVLAEPTVVVDSTATPDFDARQLAAFAWKDEEWLGFWEQHAGYDTILRVVKVKPGCVYPGKRGAAQ